MNPKPLNLIEEELGAESTKIPPEWNYLELIVEKSDDNIEYYLPNQNRKVIITAWQMVCK